MPPPSSAVALKTNCVITGKTSNKAATGGGRIGLDLFQNPILGKLLFDLSGSLWEDPHIQGCLLLT